MLWNICPNFLTFKMIDGLLAPFKMPLSATDFYQTRRVSGL
jgi:hypothetical protein